MHPVGSRVSYPLQGPCRVDRVFTRVVDGRPIQFYHLVVLAENGGDVFVPVERAQGVGVRVLLERSDIPRLLARLEEATEAANDWRRRAFDNRRLLTSGSAFDLAEVVRSLTTLSETKSLSPHEC